MPSIQAGALMAYLDRECSRIADVSARPARLFVPVEGEGGAFIDFWNKWAVHGEQGYLLAYALAFGLPDERAREVAGRHGVNATAPSSSREGRRGVSEISCSE